jgi:hypothetical protein
MQIRNPLIKHGLSELVNAVARDLRAEFRDRLLRELESRHKEVYTKKELLDLIDEVVRKLGHMSKSR